MDTEGAVIDIFESGDIVGVTTSGKEISKTNNSNQNGGEN